MVCFPVSVHSSESMSSANVLFTLDFVWQTWIVFSFFKRKSSLHQFEEFWIMDLLYCHVVQYVSPLVHGHLWLTSASHLVDIGLDSSININTVVIEEKRVLVIIHVIFSFWIPSSFSIDIGVIEPSWFEVMFGLKVPHWVWEHSHLVVQQRDWWGFEWLGYWW